MSIPMQLEFNFASLVPKTAKQEEEARRLGGSIGMDGTYVGSPGQRGERG